MCLSEIQRKIQVPCFLVTVGSTGVMVGPGRCKFGGSEKRIVALWKRRPYLQQWASLPMPYLCGQNNIRAASSVEPALEIRLGRGLKVLLGSLMPPVSCTSVLLQYSFLQLFHEVYLSLHVSRVQSMKGRRHKLHLWILRKSHLPFLQLGWEAAAWGSRWYMPGAKCSSPRWKLLLILTAQSLTASILALLTTNFCPHSGHPYANIG